MPRVAIVFPVHQPYARLSRGEQAALRNNAAVLRAHTLVLLAPAKLDLAGYLTALHPAEVQVERFGRRYFSSRGSYSQLMLSRAFYRRFAGFGHILVCQLDAWVFRDELAEWCGRDYAFVGAPLFEGYDKDTSFRFTRGLNGGLSLRSVPAALDVLDRFHAVRQRYWLARATSFGTRTIDVADLSDRYGVRSLEHAQALFPLLVPANEDYRWSYYFADTFDGFPVPDPVTASAFSVEMHPEHLYRMNHDRLPFGVHAWERHEPEFRREFIDVEAVLAEPR